MLVRQFWEIENFNDESHLTTKSKEEIFCEEHFLKTHSRDEIVVRIVVQIPLKKDPSCIGESKTIAVNRLNSLWKRLDGDAEYLNLYKKFMFDYENLKHTELVNEISEPEVAYYLPHHGVFRPESTSTPLRVVFNGSERSSTGVSFNSLQYKGGVIQDDLFAIMIRFRKHNVAFIADIKQMYRMILIDPKQRDLQRIVWKDSINEPIKIFKLSTITYGTTSAPFLATRTLRQLACDEEKSFPLAAAVTKTDFYVDDVVSGY